MELKFLSQAEVDALDDKALEAYHHELQKAGDALTAAKLQVKEERDARAAVAKVPSRALAKAHARHIRLQGDANQAKPGQVG